MQRMVAIRNQAWGNWMLELRCGRLTGITSCVCHTSYTFSQRVGYPADNVFHNVSAQFHRNLMRKARITSCFVHVGWKDSMFAGMYVGNLLRSKSDTPKDRVFWFFLTHNKSFTSCYGVRVESCKFRWFIFDTKKEGLGGVFTWPWRAMT